MQIRKTLKKYNRISLRCEKCDIGMSVLLSTHTHSLAHSLTCSLARTHRYNLCLCERSNFSLVLPHTIPHHGATPSPHTAPIRAIQKQFSKLCSLPSLRPSGGTGNGKANPISFLGTQPGQMESATCPHPHSHPPCHSPSPSPSPSSSTSLCTAKTKKRARLRNKSYLRAHTLATMAVLLHSPQAQPQPQLQPLP